MAKRKDPTLFEMALDAVRSPVRKLDEAIRNWDAIDKLGPATKDFNKGTRIFSTIGEFSDPEDARRLAQTIIDAYVPRFIICIIRVSPCSLSGKPLFTKFIFCERADRAPGIYVEI